MLLWTFNILIMIIVGLVVNNPKAFTRIGGALLVLSIGVAIGSKSSLVVAILSWLVALFVGFLIINVKAFVKGYSHDKKALASLPPEVKELYLQLKRNDNAYKDIVVDDDPISYLFRHAMERSQDVFVSSFKQFIAEIIQSDSFKADLHSLMSTIDKIFDNVSTSDDKLKQIDSTKGQEGAILQNGVLYAIACAYKNGVGIVRFMHGDHTNTDMHDFIAPLEDREYCIYMLKKHKSLSAIIINLKSDWYVMLVALGYLIMSNNDDEHHDIYSERMFSRYEKKTHASS